VRNLFYYSMYFVIVAGVDSRKKLDGWVNFLLMIMALASCLQIAEAIVGHHLWGGLGSAYNYAAGTGRTTTGGYSFLYLWNRAPLISFLAVTLVIGVILETRPVRLRYLLLAGLGIASVLIAFVRQWFVYLSIGLVGALLAQRTGRTRGVLLTIVVAVFVTITLLASSPLLQASFGPSPVNAWLARASTIIRFEDEANHQSRVDTMTAQWDSFLESPGLGHGQTADFIRQATSSDVGVTNVLVELGLVGLACVGYLWGSALVTAFRLRRRRLDDRSTGYLVGIIGFWVAVLAGFLYGSDYFTGRQGIWVVVIVLALLDRIKALASPAQGLHGAAVLIGSGDSLR
jgi:hypothetical protein